MRTAEQIFFDHHAIDPTTRELRPGVKPTPEGCKCADCVAHRPTWEAEQKAKASA